MKDDPHIACAFFERSLTFHDAYESATELFTVDKGVIDLRTDVGLQDDHSSSGSDAESLNADLQVDDPWLPQKIFTSGPSRTDELVWESSNSSRPPNRLVRKRSLRHVEDIARAAAHRTRMQVFLVRQRRTFTRLFASRKLFDALLHNYKVFPRFKDQALSFGAKRREDDVGPPPFRCRKHAAPAGFPRYQQFECTYGLRYAERNHNLEGKNPWSVYHRHCPSTNENIWILIAPSKSMETKMNSYLERLSESFQLVPFEMHLVLIDCAIANWRRYMAELTEEINQQSDMVVLANVGKEKLGTSIDLNIDFADRQRLKQLDDRVVDILVMHDATLDTVSNLLGQCSDLDCGSSAFTQALSEQLRELELNKHKAEALYKKLEATARLLSDLLDYELAFSLKGLVDESRKDNVIMRDLTAKATKDAGAMKVITVITIVFLPASVVGNFFSTSFVETKHREGLRPTISVSPDVWLFAACTFPLTLLTLFVWYWWTKKDEVRFWRNKVEHVRDRIRGSEKEIDERQSVRWELPSSA
ncbi:MAG: hypothetical protein M1833_002685 [Piccolia ochrophora]|nr:MAG: hypothetical protein M1833_002685 [Piccolia ochrophora]